MYGFDGGKKVKGRKRQHRDWIYFLTRSIPRGHILVDTQGLILAVVVTEANAPERLMAVACLMENLEELFDLKLLWVDGGYRGRNFARVVEQLCNAKVEIIKRSDDACGFQVLPRRWVVERTFSWLVSSRRLNLDYKLLPEVSESLIYAAMIRIMLRRLAA